MKKVISVLLAFCLFVSISAFSVSATSASKEQGILVSRRIESLPDGGYIEYTVWDTSDTQPRGTIYTRSGRNTVKFYDSNHAQVGSLHLSARFSVNEGVSVVCTYSSCTHTINDTAWTVENERAWKYGPTAYGSADFVHPTIRVTVPIGLTCDEYGDLVS